MVLIIVVSLFSLVFITAAVMLIRRYGHFNLFVLAHTNVLKMSQLLYPVNLNETLTDIPQFRKYKKVKMSLKLHLYILCSCQGSL